MKLPLKGVGSLTQRYSAAQQAYLIRTHFIYLLQVAQLEYYPHYYCSIQFFPLIDELFIIDAPILQ